jgi:hypothetical protein
MPLRDENVSINVSGSGAAFCDGCVLWSVTFFMLRVYVERRTGRGDWVQ